MVGVVTQVGVVDLAYGLKLSMLSHSYSCMHERALGKNAYMGWLRTLKKLKLRKIRPYNILLLQHQFRSLHLRFLLVKE